MNQYTYRCEAEGLTGVIEFLEALKSSSLQIRRIELQPVSVGVRWQAVLTTTLPPENMQLIVSELLDPFIEETLQQVKSPAD